jgi:hypothetical protein
MSSYLFVSEAARHLRCRPRDVSDLFYQRLLSDERCPVVGGRRMIPADFLPVIEAALRRRDRNGGREGVRR